jgi:hypothetical protein
MTSIYERFLVSGQQRGQCPVCERGFGVGSNDHTHFEAQVRQTLERVPTLRAASDRQIAALGERLSHLRSLRGPALELRRLHGRCRPVCMTRVGPLTPVWGGGRTDGAESLASLDADVQRLSGEHEVATDAASAVRRVGPWVRAFGSM